MQGELFESVKIRRDAHFEGPHRIRLSRDWDVGRRAMVIGCNPSNADAHSDDPTSRWWNKWFKQAGFGGYDALNLYPFCTSRPRACRQIVECMTEAEHAALFKINLPALVEVGHGADQIFVCWGAIAWDQKWIATVCDEIKQAIGQPADLWCWGKTKVGAPKHPLARGAHRIAFDQQPEIWLSSRQN